MWQALPERLEGSLGLGLSRFRVFAEILEDEGGVSEEGKICLGNVPFAQVDLALAINKSAGCDGPGCWGVGMEGKPRDGWSRRRAPST